MPSLVLLDLQLPFVPGREVLKWIRSQPDLQTLNVVVLGRVDPRVLVETQSTAASVVPHGHKQWRNMMHRELNCFSRACARHRF